MKRMVSQENESIEVQCIYLGYDVSHIYEEAREEEK